MCHTCWFGYNTPKWKVSEASCVIWRRNVAKTDNRFDANEPLPYDPWFETEECRVHCNRRHTDLYKEIEQAIKEYHEKQRSASS